MKDDLVFNIFSNCIAVKGSKRSIICDLDRNNFRIIPNALYFILTKFKRKTVGTIKEKFDHKYDVFIDEYFLFLEKQEFGHYSTIEEAKKFPALNLEFEHPSIITNAIIDINKDSEHDYEKICNQLGKLNCNFWQLRFFDSFTINTIHNILLNTKDNHIRSFHLIVKYNNNFKFEELKKLYESFPIARIDFYLTPKEIKKKVENLYEKYPIYFFEVEINNETHCGKINSDYFLVSIPQFSEAQQYNTCLNRKIGIDVNGEIKNCPSMAKSYGNIINTELHEVLEKKEFKDIWSINKNNIKVCQDCEFRYICSDCRAYIENPKDIYSKPLKCGYNPYTAIWEEWSKNPLKQKAIKHYDMKNLIK